MQSAVLLLAAAGAASAQLITTSEPALSDIKAAAATAVPSSPVSNVQGLAFKNFYQVWLENIVRFDFELERSTNKADWDRTTAMLPMTATSSTWPPRVSP